MSEGCRQSYPAAGNRQHPALVPAAIYPYAQKRQKPCLSPGDTQYTTARYRQSVCISSQAKQCARQYKANGIDASANSQNIRQKKQPARQNPIEFYRSRILCWHLGHGTRRIRHVSVPRQLSMPYNACSILFELHHAYYPSLPPMYHGEHLPGWRQLCLRRLRP
jgi:hypothetical protein